MAPAMLSLLLFFCAGCLGPVDSLYPPSPGQPAHDVFIYNNHWHTGVVLQRASLSLRARQYLSAFSNHPWVEIGWGDDAFYRAPEGTVGLALGAVFCSGGTTLHVVGVEPDPPVFYKRYNVELYHIRVSEEGLRRLEAFVLDTFATDPAGHSVELQPGLYGFSRFYAARGRYHLFHTCNNWSAAAVRKTGFPITPVYALTAGNLACQLRTFGPPDVLVDMAALNLAGSRRLDRRRKRARGPENGSGAIILIHFRPSARLPPHAACRTHSSRRGHLSCDQSRRRSPGSRYGDAPSIGE